MAPAISGSRKPPFSALAWSAATVDTALPIAAGDGAFRGRFRNFMRPAVTAAGFRGCIIQVRVLNPPTPALCPPEPYYCRCMFSTLERQIFAPMTPITANTLHFALIIYISHRMRKPLSRSHAKLKFWKGCGSIYLRRFSL